MNKCLVITVWRTCTSACGCCSMDRVSRDFSNNLPSFSYRSSLERKCYGLQSRCSFFLSAARFVKVLFHELEIKNR